MTLFILCDSAIGYIVNTTNSTESAGGVDNSIQSLFEQLYDDYF